MIIYKEYQNYNAPYQGPPPQNNMYYSQGHPYNPSNYQNNPYR